MRLSLVPLLFLSVLATRVTYLPLYGPVKGHHTGFVTVNQTANSNIFYWFVEASGVDPKTAPVTMWLNGGPGCSSLLGFFGEHGPVFIDANGKLSQNVNAWSVVTNMLYIDQPVGTGFSYTDDPNGFPTTQGAVADHMYLALQGFYARFPQYQQSDFFITGESYAGKYIPSLSTKIYNENLNLAKNASGKVRINLKGLAIGNGWVHPLVQNQAYVDYPFNLGLISNKQRDQAEVIQNKLVEAIKRSEWITANKLSNELEAFVLKAAGDIDVDDMINEISPVDPIIVQIGNYLNRPDVRAALNISTKMWSFVNGTAGGALDADEQQSVLHLLPNLIANYRVLIYTGNLDINCNLVGVESYLNGLDFPGKTDFYNAPRGSWKVKGQLAGYARTWGDVAGTSSLTNLIVRNAGHEVPFYQPVNSLDLVTRFIKGSKWF